MVDFRVEVQGRVFWEWTPEKPGPTECLMNKFQWVEVALIQGFGNMTWDETPRNESMLIQNIAWTSWNESRIYGTAKSFMADGNSNPKNTKITKGSKGNATPRGLCPMVDGSPVGQEGICVFLSHDTSWQTQIFNRMYVTVCSCM